MNDEPVYRTAPATPGLLKKYLHWSVRKVNIFSLLVQLKLFNSWGLCGRHIHLPMYVFVVQIDFFNMFPIFPNMLFTRL